MNEPLAIKACGGNACIMPICASITGRPRVASTPTSPLSRTIRLPCARKRTFTGKRSMSVKCQKWKCWPTERQLIKSDTEGDEITNGDDAIRKNFGPHPSAPGERLGKSCFLHQGGGTMARLGWLSAAHSDLANTEIPP